MRLLEPVFQVCFSFYLDTRGMRNFDYGAGVVRGFNDHINFALTQCALKRGQQTDFLEKG